MSCQINVVASITDIPAIRRCLFPIDDLRGSDSWLQLCEISVSPTGDIIAIANERRLVILTSRWDVDGATNQFQISYSGSIHDSDNIRAVICLPIVSQTKSSHVVPDWTCILLGFESGYLRFYTENCELILEEQLHNEIISNIKCRSQHNPRPDISPDLHPEELYIQYQSTVCVVAGNQLFPLLRNYRSELAKLQAKGETLELSQGNLTPKKWGFQDQASINDVAVVGVNLHGTFDHLLTASTCGGFETKYRSSAPYNNLVLAAGSRPFVGYHYALEGCPQPAFSDVAKVVASKLKSALPGWLTGSKNSIEKPMSVAMQPSESMGCRFGLCDLRRTATGIVLSPDHKLAAVSDALGRVLLVDAFRGVVLRIFKGYREAQCSFIQVPDERHSKHRMGNKVALFLLIYSSKKGTLEIFTVQKGQKVTTFTASRFSRLVYNNYGLMGFTTTSKSRFVCQFDTLLIDNDGLIKEISIPFHFALSEKNNKRARDIHLLKKLKQFLKHKETNDDSEILKICQELKTVEIKTQTLEVLLNDKCLSPEIILQCVQIFQDEDELQMMGNNVISLLHFYQFLHNCDLDEANGNEESKTQLDLETKQLGNLQKLLDLSTIRTEKGPKVEFAQNEVSPAEFLSIFNLNQETITLKNKIDDNLLFRISQLIFEKHIKKSRDFSIEKIPVKDLFFLLIHYWVNRSLDNINLESEMNNLFSLVLNLAKTANLTVDYNATCIFWGQIREILENSSRPFPALTASIIFKLVSEKIDASSSGDEDNIEVLSQESIEWSLLIGKLEDVSLLNIILSNKPNAKFPNLPKLKHEHTDVSLKYILEKGKGSVSELVARWLTISGINPENLVINEILLKKNEEDSSNESDDDDLPEQDIMPDKIEQVENEELFEHLNLLKSQFPYSLDSSVLLANMCWEYALAWQKNIENLDNLEACIKCLNHIVSSHIREGLFNLVWNTHLKIIFESASRLINKVGKLPKERLCKQDTGLTDYQVAIFLKITTNFLESYMDAVQQSVGVAKPILNFEAIWENGPQPLVELALQQNSINFDLLHLHYQLSVTLQMITAFSIKHSKPLNSLFESYMLALFFVDFQTKAQINWNYADERVQTSRIQFLQKVISASLESVSLDGDKIFAGDHMKWMNNCLDLAKLWNLDLDDLRRYELVQIYANGFDGFGDELFKNVQQKNKLGVELLEIAGKRLGQFLTTSPHLCQNVSALSTSVTRFIDQLNGDWCAPSSLEGIENLANRSLSCIDDSQKEHKLAELLLDGCQTLQSIYKSSS